MTLLVAAGLGLLIGLSLGALGGGGSILTVPALVYAVGESAPSATTGSLVIVGITAAAATVGYARAGLVRWKTAIAFGAAGVPAAIAGTALNVRVEPDLLLLCFAGLLLVAATAMLAKTAAHAHPREVAVSAQSRDHRGSGGAVAEPCPTTDKSAGPFTAGTVAKVVVAGAGVGFLTGFLGVGGGFVIVPALVLVLRYEMPTAVGTSLVIISVNSGVALLARGGQENFHWAVIAPFTLAAVGGSTVGKRIADRFSVVTLTRTFAVLLLLVAGYVLVRVLLVGQGSS